MSSRRPVNVLLTSNFKKHHCHPHNPDYHNNHDDDHHHDHHNDGEMSAHGDEGDARGENDYVSAEADEGCGSSSCMLKVDDH